MASNITVIPATRAVGVNRPEVKTQKTKVAAYCRVSTEFEEQESSYDVQIAHYTSYIKSNPNWELAGIYADDGISGTNTKKRDEFNRMIADCKAGKIDMVLTKSISRFSRNTVDCLKYTRELKALNIAVYFEKENINTLDAKGEVLMTIMAALAQQESESLSANVRLGIQFRNQQGKVQVNYSRFLGYTKGEGGKLAIVPEEAKIVRRIYAEYLDGASLEQIKRSLEADGIVNGAGNKKWNATNIQQILTNEKYIGDALLQKTYTVSVLEKKRVRNKGEVPKYYVEGSHEAIIDKNTFLRVQAEMSRRANMMRNGRSRVYSAKYALSGNVICGCCGDTFRRIVWNNHGHKAPVWRCVSRVEKKRSGIDCPARTVHEEDLHKAVVTAVNDAWAGKDEVLPQLRKNMRSALEEDTDAKLAQIDEELKQKQAELLDGSLGQAEIDEISAAILKLKEERRKVMTAAAMKIDVQDRITEMSNYLDTLPEAITEYSDALVRRLIEQVTIFDEMIVVTFKSGLEIQVEA